MNATFVAAYNAWADFDNSLPDRIAALMAMHDMLEEAGMELASLFHVAVRHRTEGDELDYWYEGPFLTAEEARDVAASFRHQRPDEAYDWYSATWWEVTISRGYLREQIHKIRNPEPLPDRPDTDDIPF